MNNGFELDEGKKSFSVVVKNRDIEEIQDALKEAESQLNNYGDFEIKKGSYRSVPGLEVIAVSLASVFLTKFLEKFGENLADWLSRKLKLKESDGEKISKIS